MTRTSHIKYLIKITAGFILPLLFCGCTSILTSVAEQIYVTMVDRRDVNTILKDTKIKLTIINKFHDDEYIQALDSLDLSIECYRGSVYLIGQYDQPVQKTRAVKIAKSIKGVKNVTTYLLPKNKRDVCGFDENLTITGTVKAKLIGDLNLYSRNIDVKSVQCNVVLYGIVETEDKITKAVGHAKTVKGVRKVTSFLESETKTEPEFAKRD